MIYGNNILTFLLQVTKQIIKTVDRKSLHLESKLSINTIESYSINTQSEILQSLQHDSMNGEKIVLNEIKYESDIEIDVLKSEIEVKMCQPNIGVDTFVTIEPCEPQIDQFDNVSFDFNDSIEAEISVNIPKRRKRKTPLINKNTRKLKKATSEINVKPGRRVREVISNETRMQLSKKEIRKSNEGNIFIDDVFKDNIDSKSDTKTKDVEVKPRNKSGPKFNESYFKDYAKVVHLTPEEAMKEVLLRKESSNYKNCSFKCELCFRGFETEATFDKHMKKHSPVS